MNYCKLLVIASTLFFGRVFGQLRFQRHLDNATTTQNELEEGLTEVNGLSHVGELVSDNDLVLDKPEIVDVELSSDGELRIEVCSTGCTNTKVTVCFDAVTYNAKAKGECRGLNQCGFQAGFEYDNNKKFIWFMDSTVTSSKKEYTEQTCGQAVMKYRTTNAISSETGESVLIDSCEPVKHDGNVVRLYVQRAYPGCSIKAKNAKKWFPTTTAAPTTAPPPSLVTPLSSSNTTGSSSSNADTTWWIVGGVLGGFVFLLILGGIGFCVYQHRQQKKAAAEKEKADRKRRVISPESLPTLDLSPYVQKEEEEKPKKEEAKKDKVAPAPQVLPSKEPATEHRPKTEASKEKAAPEIKEIQKGKKAPPPKEHSKKVKKVAKEDVAVPAPPPPPRPKPPKHKTVDVTQEETPSSGRQQDAVDDGSSSPSIEKKKPSPKKHVNKPLPPAKKPPPLPYSSSRRRSSSKIPRHLRHPWDIPQYGMSTEEWKDLQEQKSGPLDKAVEWNPTGRRRY